MEKADIIVIGAGVIGLAIARSLAMAGREVIVADSAAFAGSGTTSRNSGVIHAGIYYPKGSNKARFCVEGKTLIYKYARERGIAHKNCTKLIVATNDEETGKLDAIRQKASANGVDDLVMISAQDAMSMEPELFCVSALLSPSTGIIDVHEYIHALMADIENHNGVIALQNAVTHGQSHADGVLLYLNGEPVLARTVINAAGLGAQTIASNIEGLDKSTIPVQHLAKGNYFTISGAQPFSRLIYPVPVQGGLGAHYTMNIGGDSLFGPDVEWLPQGQDPNTVDYTVDESRYGSFMDSVRRYWPNVDKRGLIPAYAGLRPKISGPGEPDGDFMVQTPDDHGVRGLYNLYGIESPGITSSMAIADEVTQHVLKS